MVDLKKATTNDELRELYGKCYERNVYGMGDARFECLYEYLNEDPGNDFSYLDVGCGRGEMLDALGRDGWMSNVQGVEIVPALCERGDVTLIRTAADLPFKDDAFDTVSCCDVLEHVLPEETEDVLSELLRVAKQRLVVSLRNQPSAFLGHELHINIKSYKDWFHIFCEKCKETRLSEFPTWEAANSLWLTARHL